MGEVDRRHTASQGEAPLVSNAGVCYVMAMSCVQVVQGCTVLSQLPYRLLQILQSGHSSMSVTLLSRHRA